MDQEEKLLSFLSAAGPEIDPDCARVLLEMHDWNLEAALNEVLAPPPPRDSVRAPMQTNYHDTLIPSGRGPDDDLAYAMAQSLRDQAAHQHGGQPGGPAGDQPPVSPSFFSQISGALWGAITGSDGRASQTSLTQDQAAAGAAAGSVPDGDEIPTEARHGKLPMETTASSTSPRNLNADASQPTSSSQSKRVPEPSPGGGAASASASTPASAQQADPKRAKTNDEESDEKSSLEEAATVRWSAAEATATEDAWLTKLEAQQRVMAEQRKLEELQLRERQEQEQAAPSSQPPLSPSKEQEKERVKNEDKEKEAKVLRCLQTLRKLEPREREAVVKTLHAYISNLAKNPLDTRFHRINTENKNFMATIAPHAACLELLELCGFRREGTFLKMDEGYMKSKGVFLWNVLAKVDILRNL